MINTEIQAKGMYDGFYFIQPNHGNEQQGLNCENSWTMYLTETNHLHTWKILSSGRRYWFIKRLKNI